MEQNYEWNTAASAEAVSPGQIIVICAGCSRVKDERGDWKNMDLPEAGRTALLLSHGLCLECAERLYPGFSDHLRAA
jgi:hypothetical protein